jgi:hypothetical protein
VTATTSTCVDCGAPIIGDQSRCAACHARSVVSRVFDMAGPHWKQDVPPPDDIDLTALRRRRSAAEPTSSLAVWIVIVEVLVILGLMTIFVLKGCP